MYIRAYIAWSHWTVITYEYTCIHPIVATLSDHRGCFLTKTTNVSLAQRNTPDQRCLRYPKRDTFCPFWPRGTDQILAWWPRKKRVGIAAVDGRVTDVWNDDLMERGGRSTFYCLQASSMMSSWAKVNLDRFNHDLTSWRHWNHGRARAIIPLALAMLSWPDGKNYVSVCFLFCKINAL